MLNDGKIIDLLNEIETNEELQALIQYVTNYVAEAYEAGGDSEPSLKKAAFHLMNAHEALRYRMPWE